MTYNFRYKVLPSVTTVLVAEDDEISFAYLEAVLKAENCRVLRCTDGLQAVEMVKNNPSINLILMDLRMPVMDGITATVEIRRFNPHIPIIAQTAWAYESYRQEALNAGCNDFLSKPIRMDEFLNTIHKYLYRKTG